MPTAIVATAFFVRHATTAATAAATTFGLTYVNASAPGAEKTTAGTTIAVSIAAELIAVRRRGPDAAAKPVEAMRLPPAHVERATRGDSSGVSS